jgi:hypothetical protein
MWRTVFDYVPGTSHGDAALPCQDSCRVKIVRTDSAEFLIAVCADGAGSAKHSDAGAQLACDTIVRLAEEELGRTHSNDGVDRNVMSAWYHEAQSCLKQQASERAVDCRELACTLLVAVVGPNSASFAQVGDGAIVLKTPNVEWATVFWPQSGEYVNTTNFITKEGLEEVLDFHRLEAAVDNLAMFTDGLERLILRFTDRTVHAPFLEPMFAQLRSTDDPDSLFVPLRRFLESNEVNARTDDDKTLILAARL